jgi:heavy metal sensor kinase
VSLKVRLTLTSFVLFLVTLAVAGWFVLGQHRDSTIDALDEGLVTRLDDLVSLAEQNATPEGFGISQAEDTLAMVVAPNGAVKLTTDRFGNPQEILALVAPDIGPQTVALSTFRETKGTGQMRVLVSQSLAGQIGITGQSVDSVDDSVTDLRTTLLVVGPILAIIGALVTGLVVRRALVPMEAMRREAAHISLSDLDRRIPVRAGNDELATLADTLNDMLARLEDSADTQRQLIADVAHELRSPLTGLVTQLEVDLMHPDQADWPATVTEALDEGRRLQSLIDNVLLLAHLDQNEAELTHELVDLDDIVHTTVDRIAAMSPVEFDRSAVGAGVVRGNPDQLHRCIQNVVDNAVRHATSRVTVSLVENDNIVTLAITDDGPGIAAEQRERVFERFYRVAGARDRSTGGTGLGLAIVRELVTAHHGTITADPAQPSGLTMTIRLAAANTDA